MALYEITFLTKEEADPGVRTLIEEVGGAITDESSLGRRKLAYPINKETQAVYTTYVFDAETTQLTEINRRLGLNTGILRYLIVTKETAKANKEVSKTVREAIAAAEKLEDAPAVEAVAVETVVVEEAPAEEVEVADATEEVVETVEAPAEPAEEQVEEKPAKKPRAKKAEAADAAEATEEDRLKALEDKLSDILKD